MMLILLDIPDDAVCMETKGKTAYGGTFWSTADEDVIENMRRETNEERIKRYCREITKLVDEV